MARTRLSFAVLLVLGGPALAGLPGLDVAGPALDALETAPEDARAMLGLSAVALAPIPALVPGLAVKPEPPATEVADLRVALAQLAILAGANDHLTLLTAQADGQALVVRSGRATLADLARLHPGMIVQQGAGFRALRPIVVWQGAELLLAPGEALYLAGAEGAFLLVFGQLSVTGAVVQGDGIANTRAPAFRPFVLAAGSAGLVLDGAELRGLGFASAGPFKGVAHVTSSLFPPVVAPRVTGSLFQDTGPLTLRDAVGAVIDGNRFDRAGGIEVLGGHGLRISGNVLEAATGGSAVRVADAAQDVLVQGNLITGAAGNGITVSDLSRRVAVVDTLIDRTAGTGIAVERVTCLRLAGNAVTRGAATGLRLDTTGPVDLSGMVVAWNANAAVEVLDQPDRAGLQLDRLVLGGNGSGMRAAGLRELALRDADLAGQVPRLFEGELAPFTAGFLTATQVGSGTAFAVSIPALPGAARLVLASGAVPRRPTPLLPPDAAAWPPECLTE